MSDDEAIRKFRERIASGYRTSRVWLEPDGAVDKIKMDLCSCIIKLADKHELNIEDLVFLTGMSNSKIKEIFYFRIEVLTTDFLIDTLETLVGELKNKKLGD